MRWHILFILVNLFSAYHCHAQKGLLSNEEIHLKTLPDSFSRSSNNTIYLKDSGILNNQNGVINQVNGPQVNLYLPSPTKKSLTEISNCLNQTSIRFQQEKYYDNVKVLILPFYSRNGRPLAFSHDLQNYIEHSFAEKSLFSYCEILTCDGENKDYSSWEILNLKEKVGASLVIFGSYSYNGFDSVDICLNWLGDTINLFYANIIPTYPDTLRYYETPTIKNSGSESFRVSTRNVVSGKLRDKLDFCLLTISATISTEVNDLIIFLQGALPIAPDKDAQLFCARLLVASGPLNAWDTSAITYLNLILREESKNGFAHFLKAFNLKGLGRLGEAKRELILAERLQAVQGGFSENLIKNLALEIKLLEGGLPSYYQMLSIYPHNIGVLGGLCNYYSTKHQNDSTIFYCTKIINETANENLKYHIVKVENGNYETETDTCFTRDTLSFGFADCSNLKEAYYNTYIVTQKIDSFHTFQYPVGDLVLDFSVKDYRYLRATLYSERSNFIEALNDLNILQKLDPNYIRHYGGLDAGDVYSARATVEENLFRIENDSSWIYDALQNMRWSLQLIGQDIPNDYEFLGNLKQRTLASRYTYLAIVFDEIGIKDSADYYMEKGLHFFQDSLDYLQQGILLTAQGTTKCEELAAADFLSAIEIAPNEGALEFAYYYYGIAQIKLNNLEKAKWAFNKAYKIAYSASDCGEGFPMTQDIERILTLLNSSK